MTDWFITTAPRSLNGNSVAGELHKARQKNIQLDMENARLKRRADQYEQLFLAACCLSLFLGSVLLVAWG